MRNGKSRPMWLLDLYLNKSPGVILIDGDSKKTPCLDLAFEIGTTMMEIGDAQRLCVWSWNGSHWAHDRHYLLTGDSAVDTHCWTVTKEDGIMPPGLDLTECAESIISLRKQDYGRWRNYMPASILCRPLKIWKDDTCSDEFVIRCDENGRLNIVACNTTR